MSQKQMSLFPNILFSAHLIADRSPRRAFYKIWVEESFGDVVVFKESGTENRVLDRRSWKVPSLELAIKLFNSRLKSKTNPNRKSPRKYMIKYFK